MESYTLNLLSGSTSGLGTSLSITPPAVGDTTYTYAGATVNDTFYSFLLVATNVTNSSTLSQPTAKRNRAAPSLTSGVFTFNGTLGSISAAPRLTWSNSGGTVESYTLNLLSGSTSGLGTSLSITPPAVGDTTYTYAGATVNDTFYSFLLVATNVTSSSTLSQPTAKRNRAAPVITQTSFAFGGTVGSTSAAPTLVWSSTGGTIESYALVVYGDANSTPTTVLASTPPAVGNTTYVYPGSTVASYYYQMVLTATNVTSPASVITTSVISNITAPSLSLVSFAFAGTIGTVNANPTLTWSNSGGTVASYTLTLKNGATSPPGTSLTLTPPASGATTANYVYTYFANGDPMPVTGSSITITNVSGSTIVRFRITDSYDVISDTSGLSVAMGQTYTFSLPRDVTPNSYNFSILAYYGGGSPNQLYLVSSNNGLISITTFYGTFLNVGLSNFTIASYYYQYVLVATNAGGSNTLTTSIIFNITAPSLSEISFAFAGTSGSINANPTLTWSNSGGAVASYTLTLKNGATSPPGTSVTLTPPASGATTTNYVYTYFANGDPMPVTGSSITITNVSGSTIVRFRITDSYDVISDTSGLSVAMGQTYTFSLPRDVTPNSYNFSILAYYGGGSPNQLYLVSSNNGLISITTFYGTFLNVGLSKFTIASYYYQYVLVATNAAGSNTLTTSIIFNISLPSLTFGTLTFDGTAGGAAANPKITWSNSGGAVVTYTLYLIYDPTTPPSNKLPLTPAPASGDTSYTYTGTTTANYYYSFELAAYNAGGSIIMTKPAAIQNIVASVHIFTSSINVTPNYIGVGPETDTQRGLQEVEITMNGQDDRTVYYATNTTVTNSSATVSVSITCQVPFTTDIIMWTLADLSGFTTNYSSGMSNFTFTLPTNSASFEITVTLSGTVQSGDYSFDLLLTIS